MTINLQRVTSGVLRMIKEFIVQLTELSDWADLHIGMTCYKKPNELSGEIECFSVIGLFVRDF